MQQAAVNLPSKVRVGSRTVRIQQRLGNGAFGVVYKVKDEVNSSVYALKDVLCLNASALRNAQCPRGYNTERNLSPERDCCLGSRRVSRQQRLTHAAFDRVIYCIARAEV